MHCFHRRSLILTSCVVSSRLFLCLKVSDALLKLKVEGGGFLPVSKCTPQLTSPLLTSESAASIHRQMVSQEDTSALSPNSTLWTQLKRTRVTSW